MKLLLWLAAVVQAQDPKWITPHHREQYAEIDAWLNRQLQESKAARDAYWRDRDFSSPAAYAKSIERYRAEWRAMLGVPPDYNGPFREKRELVSEDSDLRTERVWLDAWPGVRAYGILITPKKAKRPMPAVVTITGHRGTPERVAGLAPSDGKRNYGQLLAMRGFVTFSPYIVSIYSEENPQKEGPQAYGRDLLHKKAVLMGSTLLGIEAGKIMRAISFLQSLPEVNKDRIGMLGLSKGGHYTLSIAALDPRIQAAVSAGWFNDRTVKNTEPRDPNRGTMYFLTHTHRMEYYLPELLKKFGDAELGWLVAPRALLIEQGHEDRNMRIEDTRPEFERLRAVYSKLGIADRAVLDYFEGGHELHAELSFPFLEKWLR